MYGEKIMKIKKIKNIVKMHSSQFPQSINKTNWYYVNKKSIKIIHEVYDANGNYLSTDSIIIPFKKLRISEVEFGGNNGKNQSRRQGV